MDGQQKREHYNFVRIYLRVSSAPAHCASSLDRSGDPRLQTHSGSGFLDRSQSFWRCYTQPLPERVGTLETSLLSGEEVECAGADDTLK